MHPIALALKGKGPGNFLKRTGSIVRRYGTTTRRFDRKLGKFVAILRGFDSGATFPLTASTLARTQHNIRQHQASNIEFAIHGYYHIDHSRLSLSQQVAYLQKAKEIFKKNGIECIGFRSPYLRWNSDTIKALVHCNFLYDSSQAVTWDIDESDGADAYHRALAFYGAVSAADYPALPRWDSGLLRIPYSLPDDEALFDRFNLKAPERVAKVWQTILERTFTYGELFTLGLHPERIDLCQYPLLETLRLARRLSPKVWIARLDAIARWWIARAKTAVNVTNGDQGHIYVSVEGPEGITVLARSVRTMATVESWDGNYGRVSSTHFSLYSERRPFIGVSPTSSPHLIDFLRQQGYLVEEATSARLHGLYLDCPRFDHKDERRLLDQIEKGKFPLVRLGRWPHGARSALCISGDIDALSLWDYVSRFL